MAYGVRNIRSSISVFQRLGEDIQRFTMDTDITYIDVTIFGSSREHEWWLQGWPAWLSSTRQQHCRKPNEVQSQIVKYYIVQDMPNIIIQIHHNPNPSQVNPTSNPKFLSTSRGSPWVSLQHFRREIILVWALIVRVTRTGLCMTSARPFQNVGLINGLSLILL